MMPLRTRFSSFIMAAPADRDVLVTLLREAGQAVSDDETAEQLMERLRELGAFAPPPPMPAAKYRAQQAEDHINVSQRNLLLQMQREHSPVASASPETRQRVLDTLRELSEERLDAMLVGEFRDLIAFLGPNLQALSRQRHQLAEKNKLYASFDDNQWKCVSYAHANKILRPFF